MSIPCKTIVLEVDGVVVICACSILTANEDTNSFAGFLCHFSCRQIS